MIVTVCEQCGVVLGAPHVLLPSDCVLGHPDHTERFVGLTCKRHYHWIDRTLNEIVELYALLPEVVLPGPGGAERTATRVGSPAPGRLEVLALWTAPGKAYRADDPEAVPNVAWTLDTYARMVLEDLPPDDNRDEPSGDVVSLVRFLRHWRHFIAQQPWVDGYADELASLHRAVARGLGDTMWPAPIGKCPNDGTPMFNTIGRDEVTCRRCRKTWAGVDLARLRLIHEQEATRNDRSSAEAGQRSVAGDATGGGAAPAQAPGSGAPTVPTHRVRRRDQGGALRPGRGRADLR